MTKLAARLCERHGLPAEQTTALLDCVDRFGTAALKPLPPGTPLRRPGMFDDGTPMQFGACILPDRTGGVRLGFEPGSLTDPVSAQVALAMNLVNDTLGKWGWDPCVGPIQALSEALLPRDASTLDTWTSGVWVCVGAHPRRMMMRVIFGLRSGDALARWRRVGRGFAALAGNSLCEPAQEVVQCAAGVARPVGMALDLVDGVPAGLLVFTSLDSPTTQLLSQLLPACVGTRSKQALGLFVERFGTALPDQSVACTYDVALDRTGAPASGVRRFKVSVAANRVLPSDRAALQATLATVAGFGLPLNDLDTLLQVLQVNPDAPAANDGGRTVKLIGLGLGETVTHLSVSLRPAGISMAQRIVSGVTQG